MVAFASSSSGTHRWCTTHHSYPEKSCAALNAPAHRWLAVVEIDNGVVHQPRFVQNLGLREPSFAETAVVLNLERLRAAAS